jgi:hypothetical protein
MDADRQQRLEALPGWVWRVRIVNRIGWDEMYGRLIVYQRANGHCRVPKVYKPRTVIDLVNGLGIREHAETRWIQNVGDAWMRSVLIGIPGQTSAVPRIASPATDALCEPQWHSSQLLDNFPSSTPKTWCPLGGSNPCFQVENLTS